MLTRIGGTTGGYVLVVVMLSMILVLALITGVMSYAVGSRDLSRATRTGTRRSPPPRPASTTTLPPEPGQLLLAVLGHRPAARRQPGLHDWVSGPGRRATPTTVHAWTCRPSRSTGRSCSRPREGRDRTRRSRRACVAATSSTTCTSPTSRRRTRPPYQLRRRLHIRRRRRPTAPKHTRGPRRRGARLPERHQRGYAVVHRFPPTTPSTAPCTRTTRSRSAGTRTSTGTRARATSRRRGHLGGSGTPVFATAGDPVRDPLTMPPSNTDLKHETKNGVRRQRLLSLAPRPSG